MLRKRIENRHLVGGLNRHGPALRLIPISVVISSIHDGIAALQKMVVEFGLNRVISKNGRIHMPVHGLSFAWLNGDFEESDVVVFKKYVVDLRRGDDRFHRVGPLPDHVLSLRPRAGYKCDAQNYGKSKRKSHAANFQVFLLRKSLKLYSIQTRR